MAGLNYRFLFHHNSSTKRTHTSAFTLLITGCGLAVAQSQAGFAETSEEIAAIPFYAGPIHVQCTLKRWDARTKEEIQAEHDRFMKVDLDDWNKQGRSPAQIQDAVRKVDADWAARESPQQRQLEIWSDGVRWVMIERNPDVKADIFSGDNPGRTVWLCDGKALARITSDGFECVLLKKGVPTYYKPDVPPLGIGYCAMPLAIRQVIRASLAPKLMRFDGWQPAAVPGYIEYSGDPLDSGDMDEDPTHFTNYVPGNLKLDADRKVASIVVGLVSQPHEMWTFSDFRNVSGRRIAFQTLWNDFDSEVRSRPKMERRYSVQLVETGPVNDSLFALDRYLKPGAHVQIPFDPEQRPAEDVYREGESLEQIGAGMGKGKNAVGAGYIKSGLIGCVAVTVAGVGVLGWRLRKKNPSR